ncbi:hypothetical protein PoB_004997400 [Plakobranchus ocellatus]|uniref:Uncharacterized protein n=1 Tax=Plakobranchus ocellatus TaxID=259542 RepID=A0AAV4BXE3_9GAST|nr:hypothetical protein PoB_004997400 [Plakobranchus ocellatus]
MPFNHPPASDAALKTDRQGSEQALATKHCKICNICDIVTGCENDQLPRLYTLQLLQCCISSCCTTSLATNCRLKKDIGQVLEKR